MIFGLILWSYLCFFFFKQKTAYEMRISEWSSDVCSSDLAGPGVGFAGAARATDRMDQRHPVGRQPAGDNVEEAAVIVPADMLEHAHRDDPVERAVERAIVDLFEPHPIRNPCFLCPPPCDRELFVGERDAEHIDIGNTVQIERHTAPAAAEIGRAHV